MESERQSLLVAGIGVVLIACTSLYGDAGGDRPMKFGCELGAENKINYDHGLAFELVDPAGIRSERPLPEPAAHFGPFDSSRYGFQTIDVFVDTTRIGGPRWDGVDNPPMSIRLVAHVAGDKADGWWRLRYQAKRDIESSMYPPKWDPPSGAAARDVPLFLFSWEDDAGDRGTCDFRHHLVLDFRPGKPSIPAVLTCGECFQHGACNSADARFQPRTIVDCSWEHSRTDFVCSEITEEGDERTKNSFERCFLLTSRASLSFQATHPGTPASIEEVSNWLGDGRAQLGTPLTVPGIGPVTAVAKVPSSHEGAWSYVLAMPASGCGVGFRFLLVTVLASRKTVVRSIPSAHLTDNLKLEAVRGEECDQFDSRGTRTTPTPTFAVAPIERGWDGVDFLRVAVEDGSERWVYVVAVDESQPRLRAESLLLATDVAQYTHCGAFRYPPQLVPESMSMHPFQATVEIEPPHVGTLFVPKDGNIEAGWFGDERLESGVGASTGQPASSTLLWRSDEGFILGPTGAAPAARPGPRFVTIDKTGEITLHTPTGKPPDP